MQINLFPQRSDSPLTLHRSGDKLIVNGETFDFSELAEGDIQPAEELGCDFLIGEIARIEGTLRLSLILPHGPDAPQAALFPAPLNLSGDGPVDLSRFAPPGD